MSSSVSIKAEPESPGFEDDVSLSPASPRPVEDGKSDGKEESRGDGEEQEDDEEGDEDEDGVDGEGEDEVDEEELYEDSLDLDISGASSKVWLVRLPKFLMEQWKNVDQISGSELGKVRIRNQQGNEPWKVKLVLNDTPETSDIPHEYDISLVKQVVDNTYVFTEKDLPKYGGKSKNKQGTETGSTAGGSGATTSSNRIRKNRYNRKNFYKNPAAGASNTDTTTNGGTASAADSSGAVGVSSGGGAGSSNNYIAPPRYVPYVKTIPKKTALVGTACHECLVMPSLKDPNYSKVVSQRKALESDSSRAKVTFLTEMPGVNTATFSQSLRVKGSAFIKATKKDAGKSSEGKATRIPKNELLDLLFKLFEEYDYWSMKGLRERTKQPETYLKEVLDTMALLIKKGPYAMKYTLKPEFKQIKGKEDSLSEYMERTAAENDGNLMNDDSIGGGEVGEKSNFTDGNNGGDDIEEDEDEDEDVEMETIL